MKLLLSSFTLLCSMSLVAQDRDRSPSVPPVATAAQTVVNDPASSVTGATVPPNNRPIALKIVGSNVKNLKGEYLGLIEEAALNPESNCCCKTSNWSCPPRRMPGNNSPRPSSSACRERASVSP